MEAVETNKTLNTNAEIGTPVYYREFGIKYRDSKLFDCMPSPLLEVDILFRF
jgi:hypothetical protein